MCNPATSNQKVIVHGLRPLALACIPMFYKPTTVINLPHNWPHDFSRGAYIYIYMIVSYVWIWFLGFYYAPVAIAKNGVFQWKLVKLSYYTRTDVESISLRCELPKSCCIAIRSWLSSCFVTDVTAGSNACLSHVTYV